MRGCAGCSHRTLVGILGEKKEAIIINVLRIHRNYAEHPFSQPASDGSYVTGVEKASSNIMHALLCNNVANQQLFDHFYSKSVHDGNDC